MPGIEFWRERFNKLGVHSIGPGNSLTEDELNIHKQIFFQESQAWIKLLQGPVLDFGCGIGRWVSDLPRPYLGLDLLPEHLDVCNERYGKRGEVDFRNSNEISKIPDNSFKSIFTCTVLQHIVEQEQRREIISQFGRVLSQDGVLLSIEWATGQWEADWCTGLGKKDFQQKFYSENVGEVIENGRRHTIWLCKKKRSLLSNLFSRKPR